ncbi:MAG: hypothetical protein K5663_07195 [Clostridiales bacterium]|nr:hypothetical protein [Clostridiales bacterium]
MSKNIRQYDGMCVRIIDRWGGVFDGVCMFNSVDYDEHEYGRREEALQIENYLFYKRDIKEIISLEEHSGPYGKFLDPYGQLEELSLEDGMCIVEDLLLSEENVHSMRMMNCINAYLAKGRVDKLPPTGDLIKTLDELVRYNKDEEIQREGRRLIERLRTLSEADVNRI